MQVTSKAKAMKLLAQHPNARVSTFDAGKYEWTGQSSYYYGREVPDIPDVLAVFPERRQDAWGPFAVLRSVIVA